MNCNRKDICYNYPKHCELCQATSDMVNCYPCFQDKDIVEVVRCKDCKFFMEYATLHKAEVEKGDGDCHIRLMNSENKQFCAVEKTDFCSFGKIKENVGEQHITVENGVLKC